MCESQATGDGERGDGEGEERASQVGGDHDGTTWEAVRYAGGDCSPDGSGDVADGPECCDLIRRGTQGGDCREVNGGLSDERAELGDALARPEQEEVTVAQQ